MLFVARNCRDIRRAGGIRKLLTVMDEQFEAPETSPAASPTAPRAVVAPGTGKAARPTAADSKAGGGSARATVAKPVVPKIEPPPQDTSDRRMLLSARVSRDEIVTNCANALWSVSKKGLSRPSPTPFSPGRVQSASQEGACLG